MSDELDALSVSPRLRLAAQRTNFLLGVIAVAGIVGWLTHTPSLRTLGTDLPAAPAELLGLLVTAAALGCVGAHGSRARLGAWAAAAVLTCIAGLSIAGELAGARYSAGLSPATAGTFLLLATALAALTHDGRRSRIMLRVFALAILALALVALVGLTFRLLRLYIAAPAIGMSLPAALGFVLASFGLATVRPDPYFARFIERDTPGAVMTRRLLPAALALPLLIGWAQALGQRSGWFDIGAGEGGLTVLMIVGYVALIGWVATRLDEMNARRTQAQQQAETERERLQVTLANIADAVVATDQNGMVRLLNPAAAALTNEPTAASIGKPVETLFAVIDERTGAVSENPLTSALREQKTMHAGGELAVRSGTGRCHPIEASAVPIHDRTGRLTGGVLVLRDAAARREADRAMRDAYAELDRRVIERSAELERATAALRESTTLLHAFAASTPDLISAVDRDGRLLMANPAALRAYGKAEDAVIGHNVAEFTRDAGEARRTVDTDLRTVAGGAPLVVEEILSTGGETRTYLTRKSPLRDEANQVIGLISVATDITNRKQAQRELEELLAAEQRLRGEAERASRAKDEFLAIVSHELRSPLNGLKGWSHILSSHRAPDPALIVRATQAIKRNVEHQARLIDDLLDTSRIISGKLVIERRPVNLVDIVRATLDIARATAIMKSVELRFATDHPALVAEGDPGRLQQVVTNLLSNAVKFTPDKGMVEITLHRSGERIELAVRDTGIGIAPEFLPHVFDRFSQADTSSTRRHGGLGIGLALVRHLIELHGGKVRAASPGPGRGATFTVELPAPAAPAFVPCAKGEERLPEGVLSGVRVFAVDDDTDARDIVELALAHAGAAVRVFESGRELVDALKIAAANDLPAALLLDLGMPDEDGFAVLARVHALALPRAIPAIAVTAFTHVDRSRLAAAGFSELVAKPIDPDQLTRAILGAAAANLRPQRTGRSERQSESHAR